MKTARLAITPLDFAIEPGERPSLLGNHQKGAEMSNLSDNKSAPIRLMAIVTPKVTLQAVKPIDIVPIFKNGEVVLEMPEFSIIAAGPTEEDALKALQDDLAWLWLEYACTPDDQLSKDARELKRRLNQSFLQKRP